MCTVTFIPGKDTYFITSNRDEKIMRMQAIPPQTYRVNDSILVYPKDADAGGTWIAMNANGNTAVLLNGAFNKHISLPPYKRSRGLVFTDIISSALPVKCFLHADLTQVEPFTVIIVEQDSLYECRWDDNKKHCSQLPAFRSYIWSSVTLYGLGIIQKREQWFSQWLNRHPNPSQQDILHFHQFAGEGDTVNDLLMNRNNHLLTVSVTSMACCRDKATMVYNDLKTHKEYIQELAFIPVGVHHIELPCEK